MLLQDFWSTGQCPIKTVAGFKKEIEEKDAIKAQKKAQKKKRNR